jgi:hypothetical protein
MTLEDVGNIGELIGAIGVVITLLYVAIQVRDNSRFVRENTASLKATNDITSNDFTSNSYISMLEDPALLDIHFRGNRGERLEAMEQRRYNLMLRMSFEGHQTYFIQQSRNLVSDEIWSYWSGSMDEFCTNPGVKTWWSRNGKRFQSSFQAYISKKIESENLK